MAPGSKDGVFNPSCFIHTGFQENFTIATASGEKIGYLAVFRRWLGAPGRPGESVKLGATPHATPSRKLDHCHELHGHSARCAQAVSSVAAGSAAG